METHPGGSAVFVSRFVAAALYLAGSPAQLAARGAARFEGIAAPLMLLGLLWGVMLAVLWELIYRLTFPTTMNWILPAAACAALTVLLPYRRACLALGRGLSGPRRRWPWLEWATLVGQAVAFFAAYHALGWKAPGWLRQLPSGWSWLWPRAMYRVLVLSPLWGTWSMLVVGKFHRPAPEADPATRRFLGSVSQASAAAWMALPLAGSFISLLHLAQPLRFVPPAAAIVAALGGGALLARRRGGLGREVLLGTGVLTQLAFLGACAAVM